MTDFRDLRESGTLVSGVVVGDVQHRDFELRLPTVRDNIDAVDEVGSHNGVAVSAAILARQLVKLGSLKPAQITFDLVAGMHPADFNQLEAAAAELEKKRPAAAQSATTGTGSGSASSGLG
jgi:phage FluMu protein gp41